MKYKIKTGFKDSPGGIVDKDPPANAGHTNCRPLAAGRLSPCTTTAEPVLRDLRAATAEARAPQSPRSVTGRVCVLQQKGRPRSPQLEKACAGQR